VALAAAQKLPQSLRRLARERAAASTLIWCGRLLENTGSFEFQLGLAV
jgi:hypothetical protein